MLHAEYSLNASTFSARVTPARSPIPMPWSLSGGTLAVLAVPTRMCWRCWSRWFARECRCIPWSHCGQAQNHGFRPPGIQSQGSRPILQALVEEMFQQFGHDDLYDVARAIETEAESRLGPKGIYPNVDFYSGLATASWAFLVICSHRCSPSPGWLVAGPLARTAWGEPDFSPSQIYSVLNHAWMPMQERASAPAA